MTETTITLRNAASLQQAVKLVIKKYAPELEISLSIFEPNPEGVLDVGGAHAMNQLKQQLALTDVLFEIRSKLGAANEGRVNTVLTEISHKKELLGLHTVVADAKLRVPNEVVHGHVAKMRDSNENYYDNRVDTEVLLEKDKTLSQNAVKILTKEIKLLQDELLSLNTTKKITLSPESTKILSDEGIL